MDTSEAILMQAEGIETGFDSWDISNVPEGSVGVAYKSEIRRNSVEGVAHYFVNLQAGKEYLMSVETNLTATASPPDVLRSEEITFLKIFKPSTVEIFRNPVAYKTWGRGDYEIDYTVEDTITEFTPFNYSLNELDEWYGPGYYYGGKKLRFTAEENGLHLVLMQYYEIVDPN